MKLFNLELTCFKRPNCIGISPPRRPVFGLPGDRYSAFLLPTGTGYWAAVSGIRPTLEIKKPDYLAGYPLHPI